MNCRDFELLVTDLATERHLDAPDVAEARNHANACAQCARRFADELGLTASLLAIAASSRAVQAPDRVESRVLAAFRSQVADSHNEREAQPPVDQHPDRARFGMWIGLAAAASFVVAFGVTAVQFGWSRPGNVEKAASMTTGADILPVVPQIEFGVPADDGPPIVAGAQGMTETPTNHDRRRRNRPLPNQVATDLDGQPVAMVDDEEVTTDFYPLVASSSLLPIRGGQVVRVTLPRTQAAAFGIPVNFERHDSGITADIVLGDDGIARAIRFVQPRQSER